MTRLRPAAYLRLALRHVRRHRRKSLATGGFILVGTMILVVLVAITAGINDAMVVNSVHLHTGDIFIEIPAADTEAARLTGPLAENLSATPTVATVLRRQRCGALLKSPNGAAPATAYLVEPAAESATTAIAGRISAGRYPAAESKEILLGADLADTLAAAPGTRLEWWDAAGRLRGELTVGGVFTTGIAHFDRAVAYLPWGALADRPHDGVVELALFLDRGTALEVTAGELGPLLPAGARLRTWRTLMPDLVQLIEMNSVSMGIILLLVFGLVGFGISNTFILTIVERYREFGILKAMGLRPGELEMLVFLESVTVCLAATVIGIAGGWLLSEALAATGIDLTRWTSHNRYFLVTGVIHPRTTAAGLVWPAAIAVVVSLLAAYLPTRICRRRSTADLLRTD